jgi:putative tryptophan/tyrosine transport system substrate-binding protein
MMRRREFIAGLGSAALSWPFSARAQQSRRLRRVGALMGYIEDDLEVKGWTTAFSQRLKELGWSNADNLRVEYRWGGDDLPRLRTFAIELVGLQPDVLLASNTPTLSALQEATRTIPIVFASVSDPIGGGFIQAFSRPGGNITGFVPTEPPLSGKWLTLLKNLAPQVGKIAFVFNPATAPYAGEFFRHAESAAASVNVEIIATAVRSDEEIERTLASLPGERNGGLIVLPSAFTTLHRERIIASAARLRLPAVYAYRYFAVDGGLFSYGNELSDTFQRAAGYVDRVLKGENPASLPVQAPTKYELVINLKTAKALGLTIPETLLATADEII